MPTTMETVALCCMAMLACPLIGHASQAYAYAATREQTFAGYTLDDCLGQNVSVAVCTRTPTGVEECVGDAHQDLVRGETIFVRFFVLSMLICSIVAMQLALAEMWASARPEGGKQFCSVMLLVGAVYATILAAVDPVIRPAFVPPDMVEPCRRAWALVRSQTIWGNAQWCMYALIWGMAIATELVHVRWVVDPDN